jgi:hypothetical protein
LFFVPLVSERLLFNIEWAIFQLNHGENNLLSMRWRSPLCTLHFNIEKRYNLMWSSDSEENTFYFINNRCKKILFKLKNSCWNWRVRFCFLHMIFRVIFVFVFGSLSEWEIVPLKLNGLFLYLIMFVIDLSLISGLFSPGTVITSVINTKKMPVWVPLYKFL